MPPTVAQLVASIAAGGPKPSASDSLRAAAKLMTLLEDAPERLVELLAAPPAPPASTPSPASSSTSHIPHPPSPIPRLLLGLTGAPGSGKSTLADALIAEYRHRFPERRVGVVAVDPSSPFTGGAVLGDRVRMMRHATDPNVFVRSMATRGHLGGLTLGVKGVVHVMGLLGCDVVLVETVGVGQSEVEVTSIADLVLLVLAPGQGDSIQLLKAGLMEIGDLFIVNKADKPDAARLHTQILAALRLGGQIHDGHHDPLAAGEQGGPGEDEAADLLLERGPHGRVRPQAYLVSAADGTGVREVVEGIEKLADEYASQWQSRRDDCMEDQLRAAILEAARSRVDGALGRDGAMAEMMQRLRGGRASVDELARELLARAGEANKRL